MADSGEKSIIKDGDYVVIQRQSYTKLHKLKLNDTVLLGKDKIELSSIISKRYFSTFQMNLKPKGKRLYTLNEAHRPSSIFEKVAIEQSGSDNRDIVDDGSSQKLTTDDILKLRDEALTSSDIVEKLITNSTTFSSKTEYSQEKYLKKKEKKYFEYIRILKPTIKILSEMYYRQDPSKILGLRIDDLSQILAYANVQSDGTFMLYESGTSGLPAAAILERIGANTNGQLVHVHQGNVAQKQAIYALQFEKEHQDRLIDVNLYSVLRHFYQKFKCEKSTTNNLEHEKQIKKMKTDNGSKECEEPAVVPSDVINDASADTPENSGKKRKFSEISNDQNGVTPVTTNQNETVQKMWEIDNERACKILENKVDALIVIPKEHPVAIVEALIPFLGKSRPIVVFSIVLEPLQELYLALKRRADCNGLRLVSNFMRRYQVLPQRTHPDVNMSHGGYILYGYKVDSEL